MITGFEVGAIFRIQDEFTATLDRMAEEVTSFDKLIKETRENLLALGRTKFPGLAGELKGLGEQAEQIRTTFGTTFTSIDTGAASAQKETAALAAEWRRVADEVRAAGGAMRSVNLGAASASGVGVNPRQRIPGPHGSGGPSGFHYRPSTIPVPSGHLHGTGAGFAAAGAAIYSAYEGLEVGDIVARGLANVYPEGLPADAEAKKKELTQAIIDQAQKTKLPLKTVAKMALDEIKTNANQPWEARMRMLPLVIQSAAREAYIKDTDPESATSAFVGQLHQIRAFTPAEVEKYGPMIAFFAAKDPNSIVNIAKSGGYHTPIATSLMGIPIEQDLAAQTILDRTGVGGKSGTWLREIATRAAKPVHDKFYAAKVARLKAFGLMTEDEHSTPIMTDGHFDEQKLLHILNQKLKGIPVEEKAGRLKSIFGERGSMGIALLTEDKMLKQYDELLAESRAVQSNADFWATENKTNEMQRLRGAAVDAQIAALAAGQIVAPVAVGASKEAADALGWAAGLLPAPGSAGEKHLEQAGKWGLGGALLGALLGIPGGLPGIITGAALGGTVFGTSGYTKPYVPSIDI
jgi:hypothetical protein